MLSMSQPVHREALGGNRSVGGKHQSGGAAAHDVRDQVRGNDDAIEVGS
jgi:hypothetical protein